MNKYLITMGMVFCFSTEVYATQPHAVMVDDHYRSIIKQVPYQVEICREKQVSGDKSADMLTGAIIGGIIGTVTRY